MERLKHIIYARKSSEAEDRQVLSLESQIEELQELAEREGLEVVEILTEAKSAKEPGRPVFNLMLEKIKKGEANAILTWKIDRLSRNPVDGGTLQWLLQQGIIKEIRTPERIYRPEDNALLWAVESGMATQFIRDLAVNTKRGLRKKCERGYKPGLAPLGYLNNKYSPKGEHDYFPDPERFPIIQRIFKTLATGLYTPVEVYNIAVKEWGFTGRNGKPISRGRFYEMLRMPDYYGEFEYPKGSGNFYKGNYEPIITKEEWELVQQVLKRKSIRKNRKYIHLFRGLLRCGECGAVLTSYVIKKKLKDGKVLEWTYYECARKKRGKAFCSQKPIREDVLEEQILKVLSNIEIPEEIHKWAINALKAEQEKRRKEREKNLRYYHQMYRAITDKIDNLIDMKTKGLIDEEDYIRNIEPLKEKKKHIENFLRGQEYEDDRWIDDAISYVEVMKKVKEAYISGDISVKRTILKCIGSEFIVKDKQFFIKIEPIFEVRTKELEGMLIREGVFEPLENEKKQEFNKDFGTLEENQSDVLAYILDLRRLDSYSISQVLKLVK
jgi:DNA invertase Pin-like site-specific DNA recombinase